MKAEPNSRIVKGKDVKVSRLGWDARGMAYFQLIGPVRVPV